MTKRKVTQNFKAKILIVEDNELNLKLFRDLLKSDGFEVVDTSNGHIAIDLIYEHNPDLILMDIQLHSISGIDIIKEIKSTDKLKNIPVIAITAIAMKDYKDKILESGCESYIAKPISIAPFLKEINSFIGN